MASAKRLLYILLKAKVFLHLNNRMIQTQVFLWAAAAEILHITLKSYKAITHFSSLTRDISDLNRMFFSCVNVPCIKFSPSVIVLREHISFEVQ